MENITVIDRWFIAFVAILVVPAVIGGICIVVEWCCLQIGTVIEIMEYRRIKKGLKDGSVIEIDGKYI